MIKPEYKTAYAVGTGTYVGEIFVFIKENPDSYEFISIPKNENRLVPKDKFNLGIELTILEKVGEIDSDVYDLLQKQFDFNKKYC